MSNPVNIALIYGSSRPGRFCDEVAEWAANQISSSGDFSLSVIDPVAPPTRADSETAPVPSSSWLRKQIEIADACIVVTPEYNHGYTADLKSLIDSVGTEWQAKPVGFVSYGGIPAASAQSSSFVRSSRNSTPSPSAIPSASLPLESSSIPPAR